MAELRRANEIRKRLRHSSRRGLRQPGSCAHRGVGAVARFSSALGVTFLHQDLGTGITTRPGYVACAVAELAALSGLPIVGAKDLIEATSATGSFVQLSSMLKRSAVKVSKICIDLRLLSFGPRAGLGELRLPARQAGSSIMPGKVNPVIPELVNQVAFAIVGNDVTVTMAAEAGQLQLNAFEPIIAHTLLQGIGWLSNAPDSLTVHCIRGIEVDREHLAATSARSIGVVTALAPVIGYVAAARIARASLAGGGEIAEMVLAEGLVPEGQLTARLRPESLTEVGGLREAVGGPGDRPR